MTEQITASFVQLFLNGDTAGASAMIDLHPEILKMQQGYAAHPLLRACVERNSGRCHKKSHMAIAELLIPS